MVNNKIVKRYALALMKSATADTVEQIHQDILTVERTVGASKDLKVLLRSPVIEYNRKQAIIREVFTGRIADATLDFMMLLAEKKREIMLKDIIAAFKSLYNERHNIQTVRIASAIPLNDDLRKQITGALEVKIGKKTEPTFIVDPTLKGGITINIGDLTFDGSVRRQIELLYKKMTDADMPEYLRRAVAMS